MAQFAALIIFFTYFYTALMFNPIDMAGQPSQARRVHPRCAPRARTRCTYIEPVLNRITLPGAVFLALIAVGPTMLFQTDRGRDTPVVRWCVHPDHGGCSARDDDPARSQLKMRHYDGFFK